MDKYLNDTANFEMYQTLQKLVDTIKQKDDNSTQTTSFS